MFQRRLVPAAFTLILLAIATPAMAQVEPCPVPAQQPPVGSPVLYRCAQVFFHPVNQSAIDANTYDYHLKARWSIASQGKWVPYDEDAVLADFWNLWRTNFLDNLWIEVIDEPYDNGVPG